ncbi:hypothetical protein HYN80_23660, partial [Vibrio parahaemolyticus]|nr:hypothetical protein [Vibrio parahaemolyticus]
HMKAEIVDSPLGGQYLSMFFFTNSAFWSTCDQEALINNGDSGTTVFDSNNYAVGVASRVSGEDCGQVAEFTSFLGFDSLFQAAINDIIAPSELNIQVPTSQQQFVHSFDVQNFSSNRIAVSPILLGASSLSLKHNCPETLAYFEHCRVTISGDSTADSTSGQVQINTNKVIPISLIKKDFSQLEKPEFPAIPKEIY